MAGDVLSVIQTGLQSVDSAMQAVSDDLANSGTTGFSSESVEFGTLLGEFVAGSQLGGGAEAEGIVRDFSQGAIVQTNSPTDLAIQGNGFFVFQDPSGNQVYSRNGHMTIGPTGALQAFNGDQVLGYGLSAAGTAGVLAPITIPQGVVAPTASTTTTLSGNLDASNPVISAAINPADPTTYSASVSTQVFDSLGNPHVLTFYFQNSGPPTPPATGETWNWLASLDGSTTGLAGNSGSLTFDTTGNLVAGGIPATPLTATPAGAAGLSLNLNFNAITQFASSSALNGTSDGNAAGSPTGVSVNNSGIVSVAYSNGTTAKVAQVAISTFASVQGLTLSNAGVYLQTAASGTPTITTAGAGGAGEIVPSSLENSNVDTTQQLVSLVVLQRSFQANSQALQTEDNILSTLIHLQTT